MKKERILLDPLPLDRTIGCDRGQYADDSLSNSIFGQYPVRAPWYNHILAQEPAFSRFSSMPCPSTDTLRTGEKQHASLKLVKFFSQNSLKIFSFSTRSQILQPYPGGVWEDSTVAICLSAEEESGFLQLVKSCRESAFFDSGQFKGDKQATGFGLTQRHGTIVHACGFSDNRQPEPGSRF